MELLRERWQSLFTKAFERQIRKVAAARLNFRHLCTQERCSGEDRRTAGLWERL